MSAPPVGRPAKPIRNFVDPQTTGVHSTSVDAKQDHQHHQRRWALLRQQAADAYQAILDNTPNDPARPLDAVAYLSGIPELQPYTPELRDLIELAREQGYDWRTITGAATGDNSPKRAKQLARRQAYRLKL